MFTAETSIRKKEGQMVQFLKEKGVPLYNYVNKNFDKTKVKLIQNKIKNDGFEGAVKKQTI